ncbi:MAG: hypothetical protein MZV63_28170 [Marinilabiliales bacterium]|nr:hypothetical protein [Marinilabiliales bacterium]
MIGEEEEVSKVLASMGKLTPKDHLNCGACGYDTCYDHALAIVKGTGRGGDVPAIYH